MAGGVAGAVSRTVVAPLERCRSIMMAVSERRELQRGSAHPQPCIASPPLSCPCRIATPPGCYPCCAACGQTAGRVASSAAIWSRL